MMSMSDLLAARAEVAPDRVLHTFVDARGLRHHMTVGELRRRALGLASALQTRMKPGDRVIVALPPGLDYVVSVWAVLLAGGVAAPAYPPGPGRDSRALRQLAAIAADCRPRVILAETTREMALGESGMYLADLQAATWIQPQLVAAGLEHLYRDAVRHSDDLALLQYTSGSTAAPKGVMISHGNLLDNLTQVALAGGFSERDVQVLWLPPYHDMGLVDS